MPLTPIATTIREDCRALLPLLDEQIRRLDDDLRQRWGDDYRVWRVMTLPGVGRIATRRSRAALPLRGPDVLSR